MKIQFCSDLHLEFPENKIYLNKHPLPVVGDILVLAGDVVPFVTELFDPIHDSGADYWVYGHHHQNTPEFNIGHTRLLTNQLGYVRYRENKGFEGGRCIEIS